MAKNTETAVDVQELTATNEKSLIEEEMELLDEIASQINSLNEEIESLNDDEILKVGFDVDDEMLENAFTKWSVADYLQTKCPNYHIDDIDILDGLLELYLKQKKS